MRLPWRKPSHKKINLALQGGGAHGAFTWGVLDHLLEDERIDIEGISGTSAGAMNAADLAHGHAAGGRDEGRRCAQTFLSDHAQDLGRRSTFDLDSLLENV